MYISDKFPGKAEPSRMEEGEAGCTLRTTGLEPEMPAVRRSAIPICLRLKSFLRNEILSAKTSKGTKE
jgi:hypothetical protein